MEEDINFYKAEHKKQLEASIRLSDYVLDTIKERDVYATRLQISIAANAALIFLLIMIGVMQ